MARVFLSHSSRDNRQAVAVKAWLIEQEPGVAEESYDLTARLWNTDTREPLGDPLTGYGDRKYAVAFSRDGHRLATASDGGVRLWPADASPELLCDKLTANMSHDQWRDWVSRDDDYNTLCPGLPIPVEG